jgi:hypothetical protein
MIGALSKELQSDVHAVLNETSVLGDFKKSLSISVNGEANTISFLSLRLNPLRC